MSISASKTGRTLLCGVSFCVASYVAGCAPKPPRPRPHDPPARLLVVTDDHISLSTNAWVELHARLAAAARNDADVPPDLVAAKAAYARAFAHDDDDGLLDATFRGLGRCSDDACALGILEPAGLRPPFADALPLFLAHEWEARARVAWSGIELAHAAFGPRAAAILDILVQKLETTLGPVSVVSESPVEGNAALLAPALAVRGPCFAGPRGLDTAVQNARVVDCVAVRAVLAGDAPLRARFGERLWTVVVVHEVAVLVTEIEPRHVSVDRRAVAVAAPELLDFVSTELRSGQLSPELPSHWRARSSAPPDNASH